MDKDLGAALMEALNAMNATSSKTAAVAQVSFEQGRALLGVAGICVQVCALLGDQSVRDLMRSELDALLSKPQGEGAGKAVIEFARSCVDAGEKHAAR